MVSGKSDDNRQALVDLHSTMVETACASESKRQNVSVTSSAMISAGITIYASNREFHAIYLIAPFLIISSIWFVTVRFYQQLARAKWDVVQSLEKKLPARPFTQEWVIYNNKKGPFTFGPSTVEQIIPATVFLLSALYGLAWIMQNWSWIAEKPIASKVSNPATAVARQCDTNKLDSQ